MRELYRVGDVLTNNDGEMSAIGFWTVEEMAELVLDWHCRNHPCHPHELERCATCARVLDIRHERWRKVGPDNDFIMDFEEVGTGWLAPYGDGLARYPVTWVRSGLGELIEFYD